MPNAQYFDHLQEIVDMGFEEDGPCFGELTIEQIKLFVLQHLKFEMDALEMDDLVAKVSQVLIDEPQDGEEVHLQRIFHTLDLPANSPRALLEEVVNKDVVLQALEELGISDTVLLQQRAPVRAVARAPVETVSTDSMVPAGLYDLLYPAASTIEGKKRAVGEVVDLDGDSDEEPEIELAIKPIPKAEKQCPGAPKKATYKKARTKTVTFGYLHYYEPPQRPASPEVPEAAPPLRRAVGLCPSILQLIVNGSIDENMSEEQISEVIAREMGLQQA